MEKELLEYMKTIRRTIHTHPCLSGKEHETAAYLAAELQKLGYTPVSCAETGLYADLNTDPEKPWILFRADIDALPVQEKTGLPFASENPGVMHACGHDGHAAMLMGAAKVLRAKANIPYSIRFVFQPSEEIGGGAKRMIEADCLPENTLAAFASHIWPAVPVGQIAVKHGTQMASNDRFAVHFTGKSAHCAMRREGKDALQAGVDMVRALDRVPDALPPEESALVFAGHMSAGSSYNVVAEDCVIDGTVRTMSAEARDCAEKEICRLTQAIATQHNVHGDVEYVRQYPLLQANDEAVDCLLKILPQAVQWPAPFLTAEDFAFFTERVPGVILLLGSGDAEHTEPLHSARFTFDESLMLHGCAAFCTIAKHFSL